MITIESKGMRERVDALGRIEQSVVDGARNVLYRNLLAVQKAAATYPPQPSRTRARTFNTYVRGVGSYPRSAFGSTGKLRAGARKGRYGKVRFTSQQLGKRWYVAQGMSRNVAEAIIGNSATYAPWVQSEDKQSPFHTHTGWQTVEGLVRVRIPQIRRDIDAMLSGLAQKGK